MMSTSNKYEKNVNLQVHSFLNLTVGLMKRFIISWTRN